MAKVTLEGKTKLPSKITDVLNDMGGVLQQVVKASKSSDALSIAAKNFALQDAAVENSEANLRRMGSVVGRLNNQMDSIHTSIEVISEIQDRMQILEKTHYWSKVQ